MLLYAGLDVHKRVVEACVLDHAGTPVHRERFDLTPANLVAFATTRLGLQAQVVVEATTNTWAVVRVLKPHVAQVIVSNPLQTKAIAQAKVKTDKVDALVLAQLLRCDFLPRVWEPDDATQHLRTLSSRRASLVADRTGVKNRLHSVLAQRLICPPHGDLFSKRGLVWLAGVPLNDEGRLLADSDLRLLRDVEREIAALDQILAVQAYANAQVRLLMTLPGVDVTVAQTVLAALGDTSRFRDGAHAAAYLGLVPSTKQSAEHCYHGPITKAGNGHARWVLIQAAQHVRLHPGPLGVFFRRLAKKKNHNVAVVATARKLVVIAWHMLKENSPYRYAQPASTQVKLARLRIRVTGRKRKSGPRQDAPVPSMAQGGTRLVKPLHQVYQEEELPCLTPPSPGEARAVTLSGTDDFVASLRQARRVIRPKKVIAEGPPH
ncbi:MAG: IS110 family transposase [Acidimicrobiales bacterium]